MDYIYTIWDKKYNEQWQGFSGKWWWKNPKTAKQALLNEMGYGDFERSDIIKQSAYRHKKKYNLPDLFEHQSRFVCYKTKLIREEEV